MALDVPSWVNTIGWAVALFVTLALYRDARVRLRTIAKQLAPVGPLQAQVKGLDAQVVALSRAVVELDPKGTKPTRTLLRPTDRALADARAAQVARSAADVERQMAELGGASGAPVDTEGDRAGVNPGDEIPPQSVPPPSGVAPSGESPEAIRARVAAEERARHPDDPEEEPTTFYQGTVPTRRPTLMGGLAGAPDPKRTEGWALGGNWQDVPGAKRDRDTLTPTELSAPILDGRIQRRWAELVAEAHEAGHAVGHCQGILCVEHGDGVSLCACRCDGCNELTSLLFQAEREIRGQR